MSALLRSSLRFKHMSAVNRLTQQLRLLTASAALSAANTAGKAPFKVAVVGSGNW